MKLIFLDIDGVLNCSSTKERLYGPPGSPGVIGIDASKVQLFNALLKETGASVVVSSTWRQFHNWKELFATAGIDISNFIGQTPKLNIRRGEEIDEWLKRHAFLDVDSYVILDDDSDMLPYQPLVQTSWKTGLTEEHCTRVKLLLG